MQKLIWISNCTKQIATFAVPLGWGAWGEQGRGRRRELLLSNQTPGEHSENKHQFSTKNSKEGTGKSFYTLCHLLPASYHTIPCSEWAHFQLHQILVYGLGRKDWQPCITIRLSCALFQIGSNHTVSSPTVKATDHILHRCFFTDCLPL